MDGETPSQAEGPVSRRRYLRERRAREEAESLLDIKSRALFEANEALKVQAATLEDQVRERTAALTSAKAEAERANAAKTAFLAMISHEIRTPLNGVLGMAEALSDTGLAKAQQDMLEVMTASGQALLSIVNDVLDLSKIEAGQLEIEKIEFDLGDMLDGVLRLFGAQAREKGLEFDCHLGVSKGTRIRSDPTRLRQVVSNLVSNAIKFTTQGRVTLSATLAAPGDDGLARLAIQVTDTGPGVAEDTRDRLFKPFSQADASITRRHGGTGLGLWISRKICRLMGGDLIYAPAGAGDEDGVTGSVFSGHFSVAVQARESDGQQGQMPEAEAVLKGHPWAVLAAEDNATNRLVLHHLLKRYPLELTMVENGALAVAACRETDFDIVLMDVNMPVMGGLEAAAAIRDMEQAEGKPHCPVIALTANAMTHQVEDYLRRGIDSHVAKPVKRQVLVRHMADLLVAHRVR